MIKLKSIINEILSDWKSDIWIHYSDVPYIKINPKQYHQDPSGIYLFPKEFSAKSDFWAIKKYAFYVKLKPNINILDVGKLTAKDCETLIRKITNNDPKIDYWIGGIYKAERKEQYFEKRHPFDVAWEFMTQYFLGKHSQWNKALRNLGYDAIFDDTLSIHSREVQMVVLDPTKIEVIDIKTRKGSGYEWIILVAKRIKELMKDYQGHWFVDKPKKKTSDSKLELFMMFSTLPRDQWESDKYRDVVFRIYATGQESELKKGIPPYEIYVSFSSTPSKNYGIGARFNIIEKNWNDIDKLKKEIDDALTSSVKYRNQ